MKSYLAKFQSAPAHVGISFEKALPDEPSKPAKPSFDGFDGLPCSTFPETQGENRQPAQADDLFSEPLPAEPSKPAKPSFDGFDGSSHRAFPKQLEADRLAADLLTAGCRFVRDEFDGDWNVRLPVKISTALLVRFEAADRAELQNAIRKLAELDTLEGCIK